MNKTYAALRKGLGWAIALSVIVTGRARRARSRALHGDFITPIYFHNPGRELFTKCVSWLLKHGYRFLSVSELIGILRDGRPIPEGAVWLSLDDGYIDWLNNILPVIQQYGLSATLFIPAGIIGGSRQFPWKHRREFPGAIDSLSVADLLNTAQFPEIEIGAHTVNHVISTGCEIEQLRFEIAVSRSTLRAWTHTAVESMAYPAGCVDGRERDIIIEAGFLIAATTEPRLIDRKTDPLMVPRFCVPDNASFAEAICAMVGAWQPVSATLRRLLRIGERDIRSVKAGVPCAQ